MSPALLCLQLGWWLLFVEQLGWPWAARAAQHPCPKVTSSTPRSREGQSCPVVTLRDVVCSHTPELCSSSQQSFHTLLYNRGFMRTWSQMLNFSRS